jgi:hypothetical protein
MENQAIINKNREIFLSYLAGIFDGEGSIFNS